MADFISREAAIETLRSYKIDPVKIGFLDANIYVFNDGIDTAISSISVEVPAADVVEVRHGRWILFDKTSGTAVCDQCHRQDNLDLLAKYCRYCGAKMDGGADE